MDETKLLSVIGRWKDKSSPLQGGSDHGSGDTDGEGKVEGAVTSEVESGPMEEEESTKEDPPPVIVEKEEGNHEAEPRVDEQGILMPWVVLSFTCGHYSAIAYCSPPPPLYPLPLTKMEAAQKTHLLPMLQRC